MSEPIQPPEGPPPNPFAQRAAEQSGTDDYPEFRRASGDCPCPVCEKPYRKHPHDPRYRDWNGEPWLNRLCNGDLVKL